MYGNTNFMLALRSMVPELTGYLDPVIITSNVDTSREKIMTGYLNFRFQTVPRVWIWFCLENAFDFKSGCDILADFFP